VSDIQLKSQRYSTEVASMIVEFHISREIPAGATKSKVEAVGSGRHEPHRQSFKPDHTTDMLVIFY
jgi:hypothetical protein